jgi:uroporphyrinogen-III synthase
MHSMTQAAAVSAKPWRVLITRAAQQASGLETPLRELGAEPIVVPAIELVAPADNYVSLDAALAAFDSFDWLVLTSTNAVDTLRERLQRSGLVLPSHLRIAAIGHATARHMEVCFSLPLDSILLPPQAVAESLAEALTPFASHRGIPARFLLVSAEEARRIVPDALTQAGAHVTHAAAYSHIVPASSIAAMRELFRTEASAPHAITFTSASTVRNTLALLAEADVRLPPTTLLASIGPITSAALCDLGHAPHVESPEPVMRTFAETVVRALDHRQ